jgi:hypothetical protein
VGRGVPSGRDAGPDVPGRPDAPTCWGRPSRPTLGPPDLCVQRWTTRWTTALDGGQPRLRCGYPVDDEILQKSLCPRSCAALCEALHIASSQGTKALSRRQLRHRERRETGLSEGDRERRPGPRKVDEQSPTTRRARGHATHGSWATSRWCSGSEGSTCEVPSGAGPRTDREAKQATGRPGTGRAGPGPVPRDAGPTSDPRLVHRGTCEAPPSHTWRGLAPCRGTGAHGPVTTLGVVSRR